MMQFVRGWLATWLVLLAASSVRAVPPPAPTESPIVLLIARGDAALQGGDSISAIGYYRDAVGRAPRDPRGYVALGRGYLQVGEAENAREAFETGMRYTRGSEALALGLAEAYERLGKLERALDTVRALARRAEDVLYVYEVLARLAERRGAFTEALAARRRKLARLEQDEALAPALRDAERLRVRALELLLGKADRLGPQQCTERGDSHVVSALLGCR